MRDENRKKRQAQIEQAAYAVLAEHGYAGTSMLKIARKARASNETLYSWYGDKQGLFRALVERNAAEIKSMLEAGIADDTPAIDTLKAIGPKLLAMLVSERAVALNRAAAADPSGELGRAIARFGRGTIAPLIAEVLEKAGREGALQIGHGGEAASLYVDLLIGDLQIRRVVGGEPAPGKAAIGRRAELALERFRRLTDVFKGTDG